MESVTCPECHSGFSRKDAMLRHMRRKHASQKNEAVKKEPYIQTEHAVFPTSSCMPCTSSSSSSSSYAMYPTTSRWQRPITDEEPFYINVTRDPNMFYCSDGYDPDHFMPWVHPFTSIISGPTGSGKSVFVKRFVSNIKHMMTPVPDRILWCYGEYQTLYGTIEGVEFEEGLPDIDRLDPREKHLIIIDDLMAETDDRVKVLFTQKSHHRNISVMYIVQNLFHQGKHHRTISLNAHYMVIFKNPRDSSQILAMAHQMFPKKTEYFLDAYSAATAEPHRYLLIDMKQQTPDRLRLRSHIFPGEVQRAYVDQ